MRPEDVDFSLAGVAELCLGLGVLGRDACDRADSDALQALCGALYTTTELVRLHLLNVRKVDAAKLAQGLELLRAGAAELHGRQFGPAVTRGGDA